VSQPVSIGRKGEPELPPTWPEGFPPAFHVLAKPTGAICNLDCTYCFFLSKEQLYPGDRFRMSDDLVTTYLTQLIAAHRTREITIAFQGGEPTIMPEVLNFMKQCIAKNKTDFFLTMATNGVKFSDEFLETVSHFSNTNFSFSLDGYGKINDYWRSGTNWNRVIANAHMMQAQGHSVSVNTVPGIYNVTNLHLLFEFLDREFPFTAIYLQVNHLPVQSVLNHPLKELVIESMSKCMKTSVYHSNGKSCKSGIDSIYNHYINDPVCNTKDLRDFFDYNDQLDRARGTKLVDFIPELEAARSYIK
jgi:sulfatase maturation enzyme AslB (radical SAM superfamily)